MGSGQYHTMSLSHIRGLHRPSWTVPPFDRASLNRVIYHLHTIFLFTSNNIKDIVLLGATFGCLQALAAPVLHLGPTQTLLSLICRLPAMLLWSFTNLLLFNLHNQHHSHAIEEDRINKPWRPLPSGRITRQQTRRLILASYPLVFLVSTSVGGMGPALVECLLCLWYNEWGGAEDPLLKNLLNGAGFVCFLAGPLEVATRTSIILQQRGRAGGWLFLLCCAICTTAHTQDFRDREGDRMTGRKTLPLVIGDMPARLVVAFGVFISSMAGSAYWQLGVVGGLLPLSIGLLMIVCLFHDRTVDGDKRTWKIWPIWIASLSLLPLIKLHTSTGNLWKLKFMGL